MSSEDKVILGSWIAFFFFLCLLIVYLANISTEQKHYSLGKLEAQTVAYNFIKARDTSLAVKYYEFIGGEK